MPVQDDFAKLQDDIIAKLTELTDGEEFDTPAGEVGEKRALRFYKGGVPPKRADQADEKNYPFVAVRVVSGSGDLKSSGATVQLIGGLFTWSADNLVAGQADSFRLLNLLLELQAARGAFAPYKLALPVTWHLGIDEDGGQPHPYYQVSVSVPFTRSPRARNTL